MRKIFEDCRFATALQTSPDQKFRSLDRKPDESLTDFVHRAEREWADTRIIAFRMTGGHILFWLSDWDEARS